MDLISIGDDPVANSLRRDPQPHAPGAAVGLFVPDWQPCEMPVADRNEDVTWVLLCAFGSVLNEMAERLRGAGVAVMSVWPGGLAKLGHDSLAALQQQPEFEHRQLRIVLSSSYFAASAAIDSAELANICHQAARTVTSIASERRFVGTWLVSEGAQAVQPDDQPEPSAAAIWGLFKCALSEYPGRFSGLVDVALQDGSAQDAGVATLVQLCKTTADGRVVAVRRDRLYREHLRALVDGDNDDVAAPGQPGASLDAVPPRKHFQPRANAAYLVTGAFGSIGLILAQYLLEGDAGGLVLQSTRPPSPQHMEQIDAWRAQGARISVLIQSLATPDAEMKMLGALSQLGLPLGGIFHLASARADGPLATLDAESWLASISAKQDALPLLRRLAQQAQVDACVYFSSLGGLLGLQTQGNRDAAHALLEAVARADRRAGVPATCILWGPWAETHPGNKHQQRRLLRHGFRFLDPRTVRAMFDAAVVADQPVCIAAQANWHQLSQLAPHLHWMEEMAGESPAAGASGGTAAGRLTRIKLAPAVFLLSAPRSGSTLLRNMLGAHSRLFAPSDLHLLLFDTMRQRRVALAESGLEEGLVRAYVELTGVTPDAARRQVQQWVDDDLLVTDAYAALQSLAGNRLLVDKSSSYAMNAGALADIERCFEDAKYIHLTRDPHAMIESFQRMRMHRMYGANADIGQESGEFVWSTCNRNLLKLQSSIPPERWFTVSYEHLARAPQNVMHEVCDFLGVPFEQSMLTPQFGRRKSDVQKSNALHVADPGGYLLRNGIGVALAEVDPTWRVNHPLGPTTQTVAAKLGYTKALTQSVPWMSGCRERMLDIGGRRTTVCEWGSPAGQPVLILHDWQDQAAAWAGAARHLAELGYRVIAPDLRQHGRDRDFQAQRPSVFDFLADAYALLQSQRLSGVHAVGHGFGSLIAGLLAVANTAQIVSLVLIEPSLPDLSEPQSAEALRRYINELAKPLQMIRHDSVQAVARRLQHVYPNLAPEALQALAQRIAEPDGGGYVCPMLERGDVRMAAALRDMDRSRLIDLLAKLELPSLWLRGARSTHGRERDDADLRVALPEARVRHIDAGHNVHIDAPTVVGAVLADFFAHVPTPEQTETALRLGEDSAEAKT